MPLLSSFAKNIEPDPLAERPRTPRYKVKKAMETDRSFSQFPAWLDILDALPCCRWGDAVIGFRYFWHNTILVRNTAVIPLIRLYVTQATRVRKYDRRRIDPFASSSMNCGMSTMSLFFFSRLISIQSYILWVAGYPG